MCIVHGLAINARCMKMNNGIDKTSVLTKLECEIEFLNWCFYRNI